jgi:hypothetical protein
MNQCPKPVQLSATALAACLFLSACGGGDASAPPSAAPAPSSSAAPTPAPAPAPTPAPAPAPATGTDFVTFDETTPPTLVDFGSAGGSAVVPDPTNASNMVGKIVKAADAQTWAGTTISTCPSSTIAALPFSASATTITARFWSPDAGIPVRLKVENAADGTKSVETDAVTTTAGAWETLTWNFANQASGTAALDLSSIYNKISVFPNFGIDGATAGGSKTYYIDDLTFAGTTYDSSCPTTAPTSGSGTALVNGVFASNYAQVDPTHWTSTEGGAAGTYIDTSVATQYWWNGVAPNDATPSFYFGYGVNVAAKPWGFGAFVSAPGNGTADVSSYSNLKLAVWGNDELTNTHPTFTVILQGPTVNSCTSELQSSLGVTGIGVQTYTLPLSAFTLKTACAYSTAAQALAAGVSQIHIQVLGNNLQYVTTTDTAGNYPNGLNVGPISFN